MILTFRRIAERVATHAAPRVVVEDDNDNDKVNDEGEGEGEEEMEWKSRFRLTVHFLIEITDENKCSPFALSFYQNII